MRKGRPELRAMLSRPVAKSMAACVASGARYPSECRKARRQRYSPLNAGEWTRRLLSTRAAARPARPLDGAWRSRVAVAADMATNRGAARLVERVSVSEAAERNSGRRPSRLEHPRLLT